MCNVTPGDPGSNSGTGNTTSIDDDGDQEQQQQPLLAGGDNSNGGGDGGGDKAAAGAGIPRWKILALGQFISLCYFLGSALTSTLQATTPISAPNFIACCIYSTIALFLIPLYRQRRNHGYSNNNSSRQNGSNAAAASSSITGPYSQLLFGRIPIYGTWQAYAKIGLVDYAGTVCTIGALQFTSLTSYTILWSLVTPAAMVFSKCFLVRRYSCRHCTGVALCIAGVILNVLQDSADANLSVGEEMERYPFRMFGDGLAVLGASLFGLLDILCEFSLENFNGGTVEYLGVSGFFAATFAFIPTVLFERNKLYSFFGTESWSAILLLALLIAADVASYYFSCQFLEISESALLNLSTLTENIMAVLFSVMIQKIIPPPLFFFGLTLTIVGLCIYETSPSPILVDKIKSKREDHQKSDGIELTATHAAKQRKAVPRKRSNGVYNEKSSLDETASVQSSDYSYADEEEHDGLIRNAERV
jgi:drug/metabolite transporter (DMT)-like permease